MSETKYKYDFPQNRELGQALSMEDRKQIQTLLGLSYQSVYRIFIDGDRTNSRALELARIIIKEKKRRVAVLKSSLTENERAKNNQKRNG